MGLLAQHGLLPNTRGSVMLDFVFLAMFGILAALGLSIYLVRYRRSYQWHKWVQLALGVILLLAVAAFEIDLQLFTDWRELARPSPYYASRVVDYALWIHLCFAVPTPLLWLLVIVQALRHFPSPAAPSPHSGWHFLWARLAVAGMFLTTVTGWVFYWLAFVA